MEENNFLRGLPNNIINELENAELTTDANQLAKEEFPDSPRGQELAKKEFLGEITKLERLELNKLIKERTKNDLKKKKPKDLDDK